jgi:hypothetical protein
MRRSLARFVSDQVIETFEFVSDFGFRTSDFGTNHTSYVRARTIGVAFTV